MTTYDLDDGDWPEFSKAPYSDRLKAALQVKFDAIGVTFDNLPGLSAGVPLVVNALGEPDWDYVLLRSNIDVYSREETDAQITAVALPAVGTAGTYGDDVTVPQFTTDAQGRVIGVNLIPITGGGGGGGLSPIADQTILGNNTGSTATPAALTASQIKTVLALVKGDVGLGNLDNTSDANKPVSTAQQTALNLKANLASPTLTGTVVLPSSQILTSPVFNTGVSGTAIDTDVTLAANSDTKLASQKAAKAYVDAAAVSNTIATLGRWNNVGNLSLRAALANRMVTSAKVAIIADSEEEFVSAYTVLASELMMRYPGWEPHVPTAEYDGFTAPAGLFGWSGTGGSSVRGPTGEAMTLTSGQTAISLSQACSRVRLYYLPGVSQTFDVNIDGVTVATGVSTAANVQTPTVVTTNNSQTITSAALFNTNMVGSTITGTGIPAGTRIIQVSDTSTAKLSRAATASASVTGTITRKWWTSDALLFGSHVVTVTGNTGTTTLTGAHFYIGNYDAGVQIQGFGHSGWLTADFVALSGGTATAHVATPQTDLQDHLALEVPDCVIFATAINDPDATTYGTQMALLMTATRTTLPNATFCLYTPEPVAAHSWMTGLPPVARALAVAQGALHADGATLIYDHSGQTGGIVDQPFQVSIDGIHYSSPVGGALASSVILSALDLGPKRSDYWAVTDQHGGVLAPYVREDGVYTGIGVFADATQDAPSAWVGYIRSAVLNGLFGGNDGTGSPLNYFASVGSSGWFLNSGVGTGRIYGAADPPLLGSELISRAYTDKIAQRSVNCLATGVLTATYANGTAGVGATLTATSNVAFPTQDGVTLTTTDGNNRILVGSQTSSFQNGIYKLTQQGTGSVPWILTRSTAFDQAAEMKAGVQVFVSAGTFFGATQYYLAADVTTVGTDAISWLNVRYGNALIRLASVFTAPIIGFAPDATSNADAYFERTGTAAMTAVGTLTMTAPAIASPAITGTAVLSGGARINGGVNPITSDEFVARSYLDYGYRRPVNGRTVSSLTLAASVYSNGTAGVGATITNSTNGALPSVDGVTYTITTGSNRILVANQSVSAAITKTNGSPTIGSAALFTPGMTGQAITGTGIPASTTFTYVTASSGTLSNNATDGTSVTATIQAAYMNGIYNLTQLGDAGTPFILTRSDSFDEASELRPGAGVLVIAGSVFGGTDWFLSSTVTTMGTDPITFVSKSLGVGGVQGTTVLGATQLGLAASSTAAADVTWIRTGAAAVNFTGVQKFLSAPILNSLTGVVVANGSSALTASTTVAVAGGLTSSGTAGIGYATGAGGTSTQPTSKATAFPTISKTTGTLTWNNAALASDTTVTSASSTNAAIAATDVVVFTHISGGTLGAYNMTCTPGAGTWTLTLRNTHSASLSEAPVFAFAIIKGVTS